MRRFILIIIFLILSLNSANSLIYISEIMYNPEGDDNNKEYIEIFSNESINLTDLTVEDLESSDNLVQLYSSNSSYNLIVEELFNYSGINASIYSVGSTIGNNLNNDGDILLLKNKTNGKIIDLIIYNKDIGGNGNNKALCRLDLNIFKNSLIECNSSAGFENILFINNNTNNPNNGSNNSNVIDDFSVIKINEFIPNPEGNDNAVLPGGEWIEFYNSGDSSLNLAGLSIYDNNNNKVSISSANTLETTIIQAHGYLVVYMNGNSIMNNIGFEKITLKNNNEVINELSYFDSVEGKSYSKIDDIFRITDPTPGSANIFLEENNSSNTISNQNNNRHSNRLNSSYIEIIKIESGKNKEIKFGDIARIKLNIYKGRTRKTAGKIFIKDIGVPTYFNLYNNYENYTLILPVILFQNCDNKFKNGSYELMAEAFEVGDSINISIGRNTHCDKYVSILDPVKGSTSNNSILSESFINYRDEDKKIGLVYKSRDEKVKEYAVYFFITALILIFGYFLFHERKSKG